MPKKYDVLAAYVPSADYPGFIVGVDRKKRLVIGFPIEVLATRFQTPASTLYTQVRRLWAEGLLKKHTAPKREGSAGRKKDFYSITKAGRKRLTWLKEQGFSVVGG